MDDVSSQREDRFASAADAVLALFNLIPSAIQKMDVSALPKIIEDLARFQDDLPRFKSLRTELEVWQAKCIKIESPPEAVFINLRENSRSSVRFREPARGFFAELREYSRNFPSYS